MNSCAAPTECSSLLDRTKSADYAARVCETLVRIRSATQVAEVAALFEQAVSRLGADAGMFTNFLRTDATRASYRTLLACNPSLGSQRAAHGWFEDDPWLLHAKNSSEPVRASELKTAGPRQCDWVEAAAQHGFRSAVIVPAPSPAGPARVGVLYLGSATPDYFDGEGYGILKMLAWPLAMELHAWWHDAIKRELLTRSRLTDGDLVLLRHEEQGHSSKAIAQALHTQPTAIDCRFQRISAKLAAPNRRAAVRVAKLYGLI